MHVSVAEVRGFRNLADASVRLGEGVTLIHGVNGAGKTNLLEAVHFALTGSSCRTRNAREMIRFGSEIARVETAVIDDKGDPARLLSSIARGGERRHQTDPPDRVTPGVSVFVPDRLELVKGPPALRRRQLDRIVATLWPARAGLRASYGRALAQRNALIARVRGGSASAATLDAWDAELAKEGIALMEARALAAETLGPEFADAAAALGLDDATLAYRPRSSATDAPGLVAELERSRDGDLARGYSGHGPHLDELDLSVAGRRARRYASQGQQRTILLALLFGERASATSRGAPVPPLLLDDVMSELDPARRQRLAERMSAAGQTLVTATEPSHLPSGFAHESIEVAGGAIADPALAEAA
jgi:DNA replication and repair protein RecF